jgi:hypothetical protein
MLIPGQALWVVMVADYISILCIKEILSYRTSAIIRQSRQMQYSNYEDSQILWIGIIRGLMVRSPTRESGTIPIILNSFI